MIDQAVHGDPMEPETDLAPAPVPVSRPKPKPKPPKRSAVAPVVPRRPIITEPDPPPAPIRTTRPAAKQPKPAKPASSRPESRPRSKPGSKMSGTEKRSFFSRIGKNKRKQQQETSSGRGWDGTVWLIGIIPDGGIRDKGQTIDVVLNHNRREIQISDLRRKAYTRNDHNIRVLDTRAMAALRRDFGRKYSQDYSGPLLTPDVDRVSSDKQLHRLRWTSDPDLAESWKRDVHHMPRDMVEYIPEHVYVESSLLGRFILLSRGLYVPGVYQFDWAPSEEEVDRPPIGDEDWQLGPELDKPKDHKPVPVEVEEEPEDDFDDDEYPGDMQMEDDEIDPADDADDLPPELSRAYTVDTSYRAIGPFQGWSGFFAGFSKGVNHRRHQYGPWGRDLSGSDVMWFYPESGVKQRPEWPADNSDSHRCLE